MALKSTKEDIYLLSKSFAVRAVTACDRSCKLSLRFSAVTTIFSIARSSALADSAAKLDRATATARDFNLKGFLFILIFLN